jgi:hypothetical protein
VVVVDDRPTLTYVWIHGSRHSSPLGTREQSGPEGGMVDGVDIYGRRTGPIGPLILAGACYRLLNSDRRN